VKVVKLGDFGRQGLRASGKILAPNRGLLLDMVEVIKEPGASCLCRVRTRLESGGAKKVPRVTPRVALFSDRR